MESSGASGMTADELRALSAAATEGPWQPGRGLYHDILIRGPQPHPLARNMGEANAELIVWLRNHADAIADLIDAAKALAEPAGWWTGVEQRQEHQLLDRRAVVRDALAALEAAP